VQSWNFNATGELELSAGDTRTIHAILRNGTGYLGSGVTNLALVCKLPGCPDGPALIHATSASPTLAEFGTVDAWPLSVLADGERIRRFLDAANAPAGSSADALAGLLLTGQINYTYDSQIFRSRPFPVRIIQNLS
jgi:hypothetical protein